MPLSRASGCFHRLPRLTDSVRTAATRYETAAFAQHDNHRRGLCQTFLRAETIPRLDLMMPAPKPAGKFHANRALAAFDVREIGIDKNVAAEAGDRSFR